SAPTACLAEFSAGLPAFLSDTTSSLLRKESYVGLTPRIPQVADVMTSSGLANVNVTLQTFVLGLTDAANNNGNMPPVRTGWSVFAGNAANKTVVGKMIQLRQGWKLVAIHYGQLVWDTLTAVHQIG